MAYTPTEWQSGDIVTSAKLNKIENGIASASAGGGGIMFVNITSDPGEGDQPVYSADKTFAEIEAAVEAGQDVVARLYSTDTEFSQLPMVDFTPIDKQVTWESARLSVDEELAEIINLRILLQNDGEADTVEVIPTSATINTGNS